MADEALQRRLKGIQDSRGPVGILARGKNIYNGASTAAHSGGGAQFGRPRTNQVDPQTQNIQPNLKMPSGPIDLNPKAIDLMDAMRRRLSGNSRS